METKHNNTQENGNSNNTQNRGFASMPHEKVQEIASKGGHASAEKAGHEGMAERGRAGGQASAEKAGHEGMAERGRAGGQASHGAQGRTENEEDTRNQGTHTKGQGSSEHDNRRGFASMPHEKVQEIASKGGRSSGESKKQQ
jgi:general stress protein YciG